MPQAPPRLRASVPGAPSNFVFVDDEDSDGVDRCIGDVVLETTLDLLRE